MTYFDNAKQIMIEINKAIIGKNQAVQKVLTAILAKGHILIEDIPGVGKTTLALAFSKTMTLDYNRLQFTPDVLPTDVLGFHVLGKDGGMNEFRPGPVMCNLFLADEINRTSSKTQSALLEVMEEGNVTIDGFTREVPKPFTVIATQNPIGSIGTQILPESQLDRFMIKISMGYPDILSEMSMLKGREKQKPLEILQKVVDKTDITKMQSLAEQTYIHDSIYEYMVKLVLQTRKHNFIELGVSPRGTIALMNMAKANAFMHGRDYMIPEDVKYVFRDVIAHRLIMSSKARINDMTIQRVVDSILQQVQAPKLA
ncbi:magnesium chelatase [Anaerocolumna cellulosilytica]|uniref:Magnesium chelatase n=1 Tax=Anaerocolumna cellulosilytica TaxID=433286 RepID=A0A6S6R0R0_9FIRM|nr:MoxR family ATPase [Anaerocolumna cellulosilytica]MBB5197982.1 MoxR-like ATPase [Anaerocolumna cellulosilytica]BCJ93132.1 magnesium chelatase [Anaerocolumna cellulosilytica]